METELIDKLFLELSQITTAKTKKELELEKKLGQEQIVLSKAKTVIVFAGRVIEQLSNMNIQTPASKELEKALDRYYTTK